MLSARNQFKGTVKSVKLGGVMAEVVVTVGDLEIVSAITRTSADQMGLKAGDQVKAVIKSTEVLIDK
jgi:molybdopterin-binding protein